MCTTGQADGALAVRLRPHTHEVLLSCNRRQEHESQMKTCTQTIGCRCRTALVDQGRLFRCENPSMNRYSAFPCLSLFPVWVQIAVHLEHLTTDLETAAYPALDSLHSRVSGCS